MQRLLASARAASPASKAAPATKAIVPTAMSAAPVPTAAASASKPARRASKATALPSAAGAAANTAASSPNVAAPLRNSCALARKIAGLPRKAASASNPVREIDGNQDQVAVATDSLAGGAADSAIPASSILSVASIPAPVEKACALTGKSMALVRFVENLLREEGENVEWLSGGMVESASSRVSDQRVNPSRKAAMNTEGPIMDMPNRNLSS